MKKKILFIYILIVAVLVIILGFVFNPAFVSKHLSPDGIIERLTIIKIYFIESCVLALGIILFFYSLIGVINSDNAKRINEKALGYAKKIDEKINPVLISLKFYKQDDTLLLKRVILVWIIFLLLLLGSGLLNLSFSWKKAAGFEYLWIAESLESGHGFSFHSDSCLIKTNSKINYFPTAHEEPGYPLFMALTTKVFGEYGRLVILLFQVVALYLTSIVIFHLARKIFNCSTGILASLILPLMPGVEDLAVYEFGPPIFAALMISISVSLIIRCLDDVSIRRGILSGFILGLSCLLYASVMLFIPLSILFLLITMRPYSAVIGKTAFAILFTAIIVVSPWTIRNFLVFGHFIPMKTGLGIIAYESNPILASTFSSGRYACSDDFGPLWKAKNAKEAIFMSGSNHSSISNRSRDCIGKVAPIGFKQLNEVERNRVYLRKTFDFILSQPLTFADLAFNRILFFFSYNKVISVLFVISIFLTLRNKRSWLLVLIVLAYIAVFLLAVPFWYRYRYPIEPIIVIVASYLPALVISKLHTYFCAHREGKDQCLIH